MAEHRLPVFSAQVFVLGEGAQDIEHVDLPASIYRGPVHPGTWSVVLSNGVKEIPVALNVPSEDIASQLAAARGAYQEVLVGQGVFTGTDDVLVQCPEGDKTLVYKGFEQ